METCDYCLVPFVKSGSTNCCINCGNQALTNSTLRVVASNVLSWLGTTFGSGQLEKIPLVLVDPSDMEARNYGLTEWMYSANNFEALIRLRSDMPMWLAEEVLAHEYAHVLLVADHQTLTYQPSPPLTDYQVEGFCEVVRGAFVVSCYPREVDRRLKRISENTVPVYGQGFRSLWPRVKDDLDVVRLRHELLGWSPKSKAKVASPNSPQITPIPTHVPAPVNPSIVTNDQGRPIFTLQPQPVPSKPNKPSVVVGGSHRPTITIEPDVDIPAPSVDWSRKHPDRPIIRLDN